MKINIVGTSGSGKSTIARQLGEKLNIPVYEMDRIFWKPNWKEPTDDEFFTDLKKVVSYDAWILDGNYSRTTSIKWEHVDIVVWVDYSFARTLYQVVRRALIRSVTQVELWPGTNNRESFARLFSKQSIVLWTLSNYSKNKTKYQAMMHSDEYKHIRFIRVQSPKEARALVRSIAA